MTEDGPLVSAVVPAYNCEAYVAEAVESVLAQTWKRLECIVVDDGSTDGTASVLAGFGDKIRYLRTPNRGPAAARNTGAGAAHGELIAFLDADDLWDPVKIERQVALFQARPDLGLVYCGLRIIDGEGRHLSSRPAPDPAAVLRNTLLDEPPSVSLGQTGVIPYRIFLGIGGFDERLSWTEDGDLAWRLAAQFPIAAVQEPLSRYRRHPGQRSCDVDSYARESHMFLEKTFGSELLPAEFKALKRRSFANRALGIAHEYRASHSLLAARWLLQALWHSPPATMRRLALPLRQRVLRIVDRG